ncbi:MerR family transcriptional regulator [Paenibacillus sp. FSL H8-0079]|uniref:MerR family transcriptional regulator n=1 Tax=Paenibacillus sp. FSL H8-0079 TaxID=2921375 RepID=UPI0030EB8E7D
MTYSISEVAKKLDLTVYTLRYYDKEGLMPFVERTTSGTRLFKDSNIDFLKIIQCLKLTGMTIKDIKNFVMFTERKAIVEGKMEELQRTMEVFEHKCSYYETALEAGTEEIHEIKRIENALTN